MPGSGINYGSGLGGMVGGNCCCNFPTLIVLILIVLQFSKHHHRDNDFDGCDKKDFPVGNGILFIIALFFLSCCNPCRTSY